ncbi:methyltransferase [Micromonospora sp. DT48]|uniref:methyltransferase n=1 Tax=unclassified Micromonospora TaxID=2617518 RepID=UPI0012BC1394|nr:methyltransferase [Micromonospora sp. CP22]MTK01466.1 methyltransferase [Micromonospora sp. CP22]
MELPRHRVDLRAMVRLTELADYVVPFCLRVACDLRLADHLADGPRSVEELADLTGTRPGPLLRLLRTLASREVFAETTPTVFALTDLAQPLRSDHPLSLADAYPLLSCDVAAWGRLDHSVRTGQAAFDLVHGTDYWQYMATHPDESRRFDASQRAATRLELRSVLGAYPWSELNTVVDLGGGDGGFLAGILARFRHLRGTLFDLPHVASGAAKVFADAGVSDRAEAVGGSFLEPDGQPVPAGADAYLFKRVLYHWDDESATVLLRKARAAMRPDSRLLIIEPVVDPVVQGEAYVTGLRYDMLLLTMAGGGAREVSAIENLARDADLRLVRTIGTLTLPILEICPA